MCCCFVLGGTLTHTPLHSRPSNKLSTFTNSLFKISDQHVYTNSAVVTRRAIFLQLVAKAQRRKLRTSFSNLPHSLNGGAERGLPCASRYTVFIASISFYLLMFGYPPSRRGVKTRETGAKHSVAGFHSQKQRLEK